MSSEWHMMPCKSKQGKEEEEAEEEEEEEEELYIFLL